MRILICSLFAPLCLVMSAPAASAQRLVYMVTFGNTPGSLRAQYPNGIFGMTERQRLAMTRQTLKNEIWSVSLADGKRTLLFSDEGMDFEINPTISGYAVDGTRNVAYVKGVERSWQDSLKRAYETPKGVYEIALDGSNHFRRLFDVTQNMSAAMVNAAGTRAAFWGWEDKGGYFLYVHELPSGKLLTRANITNILQTRCGNCLPEEAGWLADGNLYFTMEEGDEDDDADAAAADAPRTRLISERGEDLGSLSMHAGEMNLPDYKREISNAPYLIAQAADGSYVFRDYGEKKGPQPKPPAALDGILVVTGADFKPRRQIPLEKSIGAGLKLSLTADGKLLAFVEDRRLQNYKTERHIWAKNLQTGEDKELLAVPPPNPPNSAQPSYSAVILGWLEK